MGHFRVDAEIVNARRPKKAAKAQDLLVDSGSEFTWVPEALLKNIGVKVEKKDVPFCMANGQTITRAPLRGHRLRCRELQWASQPDSWNSLGSCRWRRLRRSESIIGRSSTTTL